MITFHVAVCYLVCVAEVKCILRLMLDVLFVAVNCQEFGHYARDCRRKKESRAKDDDEEQKIWSYN